MNDTSLPDKQPFRCIVDFDLFRRAMTCASREETRHYLQGVCIEPHKDGGALLVATDGHRLICLRDPHAVVEGGPGIVRLTGRTIRQGAKARRHTDSNLSSTLQLVVDQGRASVALLRNPAKDEPRERPFHLATMPGLTVMAHQWADVLIDGTFPAWRVLVGRPDLSCDLRAVFRAGLIEGVARALCVDDNGYARVVPIAHTADERATDNVRHLVFGTLDGFGIVMPMRFRTIPTQLPDWMEAV